MSVIDQSAPTAGQPTPHPDNNSGGPFGTALFAVGVLGILGLIAGLIALAFVALVRDDNGGGGAAATEPVPHRVRSTSRSASSRSMASSARRPAT